MSRERGATLVEAAISLTLVLLIVFGVIEVGRYVTIVHGANTAAREGARYGIAVGATGDRFTDCSEIQEAAIVRSGLADLQTSNVSVTYVDGGGTLIHDCSGGDPDPLTIPDGSRVVVQVARSFQFITPLAGPILGPLTVTATDARTIFQESGP